MLKLPVISLGILSGMLFSRATVDGPALGDNVSISPDWAGIKHRLIQTVQQPEFWAPVAVAAVLQVDDQDKRLADRIAEDRPLFGSTRQASEASDDLRDLTKLSYISTALVSPVNKNASWINTKSKLLFSEWAGVEATGVFTGWLKKTTERERPDGSNNRSFPSGHTSKATAQAQFAIINTAYLPLHEDTKTAMNAGFNSLAIGTAWARIEAGKHHPSDVLAGWSLGYLVSELTRVFIEGGGQQQPRFSAEISDNSWQIVYQQFFY